MVHNRKQAKRKIGNTDNEKMKEAVQKVITEGKSIRNVCKTNIKFSTLRRYVEKARDAGKKTLWRIHQSTTAARFSLTMKRQEYLIKAEKIQYGLTRKEFAAGV